MSNVTRIIAAAAVALGLTLTAPASNADTWTHPDPRESAFNLCANQWGAGPRWCVWDSARMGGRQSTVKRTWRDGAREVVSPITARRARVLLERSGWTWTGTQYVRLSR